MGFVAVLIVLGMAAKVNGQAYATLDLPNATPYDINSETVVSPAFRNNINPKAVRHFTKNFSEVTDEKWYYTEKMIVAIFALDGINYRIDYEKNGDLFETIRTYDETKLSADLRQDVKDSYRGYNISLVQEIEQPPHAMVYVINLEGKTKLINLQVCNGIFYEWRKFNRSK